MSWDAEPVVGQWYRHLEKDYEFKVVAVNEDEGIVEIQYLDDEVDELDIDSWYEWDLETIASCDKGTRTRGNATSDEGVLEEEEEEEDESFADSVDEDVEEDEDDDEDLDRWQGR